MSFKEDGDCRVAIEKAPKFRVKIEHLKLRMKELMRRPLDPAHAEQRSQTQETEVAFCYRASRQKKTPRTSKLEIQLTSLNPR